LKGRLLAEETKWEERREKGTLETGKLPSEGQGKKNDQGYQKWWERENKRGKAQKGKEDEKKTAVKRLVAHITFPAT